MNIRNLTPRQIDEILAPLYAESAKLTDANANDRELIAKARKSRYSQPKTIDDAEARIVARDAKLAEIAEQIKPFETEYNRRPWTRAFLALSNPGHVHGAYWCHTLHRGQYMTPMEWKTEYSGLSQDEIIEAAGEKAGTCCYPDAPVTNRPSRIVRTPDATDIARQEREEKRNAKAKVAAEKSIVNPDGTPVEFKDGSFIERPKTEQAAKNHYSRIASYVRWYGAKEEYTTNLRILALALAHKAQRPVEDVTAELEAKADAKHAKESR